MAEQLRSCVICGSNTLTLHLLPKKEEIRKKWLEFIFGTRPPAKYCATLVLCSNHFDHSDFSNLGAYSSGFASRLLLKPGSVPSQRSTTSSQADTDSKVSEICIIQGCNRTEELLSFPKDPSTLQQWMVLLDGRLKHPVNSSSTVCSVHFTPDCFTNWQQKQSGVAAILTLKADALPSLFMDDRSKGYSPRTRNVACQFDIAQRSVGTQLSKGTLLHVRSKAIQTPAVTHISLGDDMDFLLHPPKTLKESGDPKRSSSYVLGMQQYTVTTVRKGLMAGVVVNVANLLQLFQKCLKCCSDACSVATERKGLLFHVVQQCWGCGNTRNWASHPPDQPADQPPPNHTPPDQQLTDPDTLEMAEEPVGRAFKDTCMEITGEEVAEDEEEEEDEEKEEDEEEEQDEEDEKQQKRKRKRRDSDEEWTPNLTEILEASDEESEGADEEEEHVLQVEWCCDCGEEASARCLKQKHLQLYCCAKCGYRDGDQELDCTDGQQTQRTLSPEAPTAADQESSCDVSQAAERACSPDANSNNKQTASSDRLEDSNSISSEEVITSASQHAITSGIQEATSDGVNELGSSCSVRDQGSVGSSDHGGSRNESPEDTSSRDQDGNTASQVESSNSCHLETSAANEARRNPPKYAVYFNDPYSLQIHMEQLHGGKRELCPDCGKFLIRRDGRTPHVCDHKVKPFSCLTCGKRCINEAGLRLHSQLHTEDRGLSCQYCYEKFRFQEDKQEHEKTHQGESLKYRCSECPKRFADRFRRGAHRKTHWKHGRFFCKVCNKGFPKLIKLQRHEVVHTGLKPFSCEVCDMSFNQRGHLKSHMRLHTGEKPFKCQDCGQCFNHNVSLKNHIQRKHGPGAEGD
ncbi:oocyte zinc finger protein XlCOF7.1-like [Alosa alosa]|uniref:oocyte zinc finger protein XlCOF7.1-like n=1 Tax=Alosa alosa TaxID=278164 RepID=UPI0020154247|nr:oocyte zinc finger protein XlCOF7.1-like [Alosa alosa]